MNRIDRDEIKDTAKETIRGNLFILIIGGVLILLASFLSFIPYCGWILNMGISGGLTLGYSIICLRVVRKEETKVADIMEGFNDILGTFVTYLLRIIYVVLWTLLLIVPGIIKGLSYSLTFYIMADDKTISGNKAIEKSMDMMHGYKMELFKLYLSFIGWILLSILTFGILFLYVGPYINAATTVFYEKVKAQYNKQPVELTY